jgi:hypothetical protein
MSEKLTAPQAQIMVDFLRGVFHNLVEPLHSQLAAQLVVLETLKIDRPELVPLLDAAQKIVPASPALQESMHQRYHVELEKFLERVLECARDAESLQHLSETLKTIKWN